MGFKIHFVFSEHMSYSLSPGIYNYGYKNIIMDKNGYYVHKDFIAYCTLDKVLANLEIWNDLKEIFITKWWVKCLILTWNVSFSNTPTFALIVLVLQITIVMEWKSWHSCFLQLHQGSIANKVIWCGISLLVILLQTKSLFVRVHSPVISNIPLRIKISKIVSTWIILY